MVEIKIEKSLLKVLAVVAVVVVVGVVWVKRTSVPTARVASPVPVVAQSAAAPAPVASSLTKENTGGDVTIGITPVVAGDAELVFDVAINTHTVDMSAFDPKKQIVLVGIDGEDVLSSNMVIEGSGHHQQLRITFPKVEKPWKLLVRDVGGVSPREFSWN